MKCAVGAKKPREPLAEQGVVVGKEHPDGWSVGLELLFVHRYPLPTRSQALNLPYVLLCSIRGGDCLYSRIAEKRCSRKLNTYTHKVALSREPRVWV